MFRKNILFIALFVSAVSYSQEELVTVKNSLKNSTSFVKSIIPIVNKKNHDISLFFVDSKKIYGYLMNEDFEIIHSLSSDDRSRKYKMLLGCSVKDKGYRVYMTNKKQNKFATINFSYANNKSELREFSLEKENEKFVQTVDYNNKFYLISVLKHTSIFKIYSFDDDGNYVVNIIDFSQHNFQKRINEKVNLYSLLPGIYSNNASINLKKIDETSPSSIEVASESAKLFVREGRIIFTFDQNENFTQILTVDLNTFDKKVQRIKKPLFDLKPRLKKTNSFIDGDFLFVMGVSSKLLTFKLLELKSEKIVKEISTKITDTIFYKNSPIIQEGGLYDSHRELEKTKKFLRKINSGDIGISVSEFEKGFKITIGGKKEINRGGAMMPMVGFGSIPMASFGGVSMFFNPVNFAYRSYSSTKSTYINCLFDYQLNHIEGEFPENEFDKIKNFSEGDSFELNPKKETVFRYKNYYIKGIYSLNKEEYLLRMFKN